MAGKLLLVEGSFGSDRGVDRFFVTGAAYDSGHEEYKSLSSLMEHRDGSC